MIDLKNFEHHLFGTIVIRESIFTRFIKKNKESIFTHKKGRVYFNKRNMFLEIIIHTQFALYIILWDHAFACLAHRMIW